MTASEILLDMGIKQTRQRLDVLNALKNADAPMSAEQIFEKVKDMSLSTVYRTLECFCENGIVSGESIKNSQELYYAIADNRHRHFAICLGCSKMKYIDVCPVHNLSIDNFTITGHKLELYGYCEECAEKN